MKIFIVKYIRKSLEGIKKIIFHKYKPQRVLDGVYFKKGIFNSEKVILSKDLDSSDTHRIFQLQNGQINTDNCFSDCYITQKKDLIHEISFSYANGKHIHAIENNIFDRFQNSEKTLTIHGSVFSLLSGGGPHNNYYHWLFDSLPRLKILQESSFNKNVEFYYVPNYSKFKLDSLHFMGIQEKQIIDSRKYPHLISDCIIATNHPNRLPVPKWICEFLRTSFLPIKNIDLLQNRHIFISRNKAKIRRILNENLLFEELSKYGFEIIILEDLSFKKQVETFWESNLIVSPHGAGLANLVFCKPGTQIIELFPPNSHSDIFKNISRHVELNYSHIEGLEIEMATQKSNLHSDFKVDINSILNRLEIAIDPL